MLLRTYGIDVGTNMYLLRMHEDRSAIGYQFVTCADYTELANDILCAEYRNLSKKAPAAHGNKKLQRGLNLPDAASAQKSPYGARGTVPDTTQANSIPHPPHKSPFGERDAVSGVVCMEKNSGAADDTSHDYTGFASDQTNAP